MFVCDVQFVQTAIRITALRKVIVLLIGIHFWCPAYASKADSNDDEALLEERTTEIVDEEEQNVAQCLSQTVVKGIQGTQKGIQGTQK